VQLIDELCDSLFPPLCRVCDRACADGLACGEHALPHRPRGARCGRCSAALPAGVPDASDCAECRRGGLSCGRVIALGDYGEDGGLREWILALKHRARPDLARPLGIALGVRWRERAAAAEGAASDTVFVPVPLHISRRIERGYDQAWLVAQAAAESAGARAQRALRRTRATAPQGTPGPLSRASNVRDAFALRARAARALAGQRVWLVDDVVTSGATAEECARALRAARPKSVGVLCLARA
jgi:ComF family protein